MTRQTKAATEVRSLIERVLDLKKEQDALAEDIRGIYLEARQRGWNKTSIGQAVSIIRKRDKDASSFDNVANDTAQYLQAYYGTGTLIAPHAHEDLPAHDPETGEIAAAPVEAAATESEPSGIAASPSHEGDGGHRKVVMAGGSRSDPEENVPDYLRRGHPANSWVRA